MDLFEAELVLVYQESDSILVHIHRGKYRLPIVSLSRQMRPARAIQAYAERAWNLTVAMLDFLRFPANGRALIMAEVFAGSIPAGMVSIPVGPELREQLSDPELELATARLQRGRPHRPGDAGWICDAVRWVESVTGDALKSPEALQQWNASSSFSLLYIPMEHDSYWLKATGSPNTHELASTRFVANLQCGCVPDLLAWREDWLDVAHVLDNVRETPVIVQNKEEFEKALLEVDK